MKAGDLVTLSSYALKKSDLWKWKYSSEKTNKPLVGLVIKTEENPRIMTWTSKNERVYYYVKWVEDGPDSRWGNSTYYRKNSGYFFRKDLKFLK
jgi:hypothetical protein